LLRTFASFSEDSRGDVRDHSLVCLQRCLFRFDSLNTSANWPSIFAEVLSFTPNKLFQPCNIMQILFPLMERMPNTNQKQSQFEDIEKSQLRAWMLVTKTFASHADCMLDSPSGIEKFWFKLISINEKLYVEAKTALLKDPLRDQLFVVFGAAKKTKLAANSQALQKTWTVLEKSAPDAKDMFDTCSGES